MLRLLSLLMLVISFSALAQNLNVEEENFYNSLTQMIKTNKKVHTFLMTPEEKKIYVDVLWDLKNLEDMDVENYAVDGLEQDFDILQKMRFVMMLGQAPFDLMNALATEALVNLKTRQGFGHFILAYEKELNQLGMNHLVFQAKVNFPEVAKFLSTGEARVGDQSQLARDLWESTPDLTRFAGGKYNKGIKLYMFCSTNRLFPCLMLGKDAEDRPILNSDGTLWTHQSLASSARNIPSYQRNGNTPAGVLTIDGVMPVADQNLSFGKFRRLMLDFIPASQNETILRSIIPEASRSSQWWMPSVVARDVGRSLLRIHGTGRINTWPDSSWYPFIRTSGCIAQRENTYNGVEYKDQRILLDTLMVAQGLEPVYANESRIKGLLYFIEVNDQAKAVTVSDLGL